MEALLTLRMSFDPKLTISEVQAALGERYDIDGTLPTGGQGALFRGKTRSPSKCVAIKIYYPDQLEDRLDREIEALRQLRRPTLVELCEAGDCEIRGSRCRLLVTSFVEGEPLDVVLARDGPLSIALVARVGRDVADAIDAIWSARIVHRDIKPNNVMLTPNGRCVLLDLGVARHLDMSSLTTAGKTWGTRGYFSPEQCAALPLTCRSDVFALGILLQECLLGRHPTGRRQENLLHGGPSTAGLRDAVPSALTKLIDRMVAGKALQRPTPAEVVRELDALIPTLEDRHP